MKAKDIMTTDIVTVPPDLPARAVASRLVERGISAAPVVEDDGTPVGIVSEGDLIGRAEADRAARRDWWLQLAAGGGADVIGRLNGGAATARDLMSAPLVTVEEDTDVTAVARLLIDYGIKRVPVLRQGRIVGIVSRADLLRALTRQAPPPPPPSAGLLARAFADLDGWFLGGRASTDQASAPAKAPSADLRDFRSLVAAHQQRQQEEHQRQRRQADEQRQTRVAELIGTHLSDGEWQAMLAAARAAAADGAKDYLLLRFPSALCSDGGRAINVVEPDWPATLRGEAAEIYLRWQRDLKPQGFHLAAQILEFPGGLPGDAGLFLVWAG